MKSCRKCLCDYTDLHDYRTGNGFLKSSDEIIPEYMPDKDVAISKGEIWEVMESGEQRLCAVFDEDLGTWIPVRG